MEWLANQDSSHDLLTVLHPPYSLVIWNADTGTKLWKKTYTESLQSFAFDPYDPTKLACTCHQVTSGSFMLRFSLLIFGQKRIGKIEWNII